MGEVSRVQGLRNSLHTSEVFRCDALSASRQWQESGIGAYPTGRGWTAVAMDRGKGFNPARHKMTAKASRV